MNTKDIFHITEDQALDVDDLKETFKDKADLRAALEDYFHIYDDYAEMSEDDFDKAFEKYTDNETSEDEETEIKSSVKTKLIKSDKEYSWINKIPDKEHLILYSKDLQAKDKRYFPIGDDWGQTDKLMYAKLFTKNNIAKVLNALESQLPEDMYIQVRNTKGKVYYTYPNDINSARKNEIESSAIGDIKDQFALGKIKEDEVITELTKNGKGKREAKKILEKWKSNGVVKSSVDSVADEIADYFGTEAGEDNVVECDNIITHEDSEFIKDLLIDDEDVKAKIGLYTVRVEESPELTNAVDLSVEEDEDNVTVSIEKPEDDFEEENGETSFVQINSEEDYDDYGVHLPEGYDFEDVKGMWWEIDSEDGISMKEVIQQSGDEEVFTIIDNDRIFFDTAYNYIFDSDAEPEDYGFIAEDFEEGKYIGE